MRHILTQAFQVKNIEGRPAMKRLLQDVKDNKIEMVLLEIESYLTINERRV